MKFPNTVSLNTYKAYINSKKLKKPNNTKQLLNAIDLDWDVNYPESLRVLCVKKIVNAWHINPIYKEIINIEDRNYLLDIIDVTIPIHQLAEHITDNVLWKRCYQNRWPTIYPQTVNKSWISIFMEKYLAETLENLKPIDYVEETIQNLLEICATHVDTLKIQQLQPALDDLNNHIPFDLILSNLPELKRIDLTYDLKTIGNQFYLGCANVSKQDVKKLSLGIEKCYEMTEFRLHSTRLEPYMMQSLSRALSKAGHNLKRLEFSHCCFGDIGLAAFLDTIHIESLPLLKHLILTNNQLTSNGVLKIVKVLLIRNIETLDLRLNAIESGGAAAVLGIIPLTQIKSLNISCCSIDHTINVVLLRMLRENNSICRLNISTNKLGTAIGEKLQEVVCQAKQLQELDIRNTGVTARDKWKIDSIILDHRDSL